MDRRGEQERSYCAVHCEWRRPAGGGRHVVEGGGGYVRRKCCQEKGCWQGRRSVKRRERQREKERV